MRFSRSQPFGATVALVLRGAGAHRLRGRHQLISAAVSLTTATVAAAPPPPTHPPPSFICTRGHTSRGSNKIIHDTMEMKPDVGRGGGVHQRGDGCNQAQLVAPFRRYEGVESFRLFSFPPNPPPLHLQSRPDLSTRALVSVCVNVLASPAKVRHRLRPCLPKSCSKRNEEFVFPPWPISVLRLEGEGNHRFQTAHYCVR